MKQPMVSWLMPMYNDGKRAKRAIDSMLAQTYQEFEVIIVLDPSNEETEFLCTEYEKQDNRICVIRNKERQGIAGSLNIGLKVCRGKYIARMDADDYSYPERLELQVAYMESHPQVGVLGGNVRVINSITGQTRIRYHEVQSNERIKAQLLFSTCFMHPAVMLRNHIENLFYPDRVVEDYALFSALVPVVQMAIQADVVLDYYEGEQNTSKLLFKKVRKDSAEISRETIKRELGLETEGFSDSLFGWRNLDTMPENPQEFLREACRLYHEILDINEKKHIFDAKELCKVVNLEWKKTLALVLPLEFWELYKPVETLSEIIINQQCERAKTEEVKKERMILYGTGYACQKWLEMVSEQQKDNIVCFCDSNPEKWDKEFNGKKIIAPDKLKEQEFDYISVAVFNAATEIEQRILEQGIPAEKIKPLPIPEQTIMYWLDERGNVS